MGWLIVVAFGRILAKVPLTDVYLLIAGDVAYTVGVFFWTQIRYYATAILSGTYALLEGLRATTLQYFSMLFNAQI